RLARDELPIDFAPAPHERVEIPHGFVELRSGVERVVIDGISFELDGSPARLVGSWAAEIWFGDAPYARIADSTRYIGPPPAPTSTVIGREFPPALRAAI